MFLEKLPHLQYQAVSSTEKVKVYNDRTGTPYVVKTEGLAPGDVVNQISQLMLYYFIGALLPHGQQEPAHDARESIANDAGCFALEAHPEDTPRRYFYCDGDVAVGVVVSGNPTGGVDLEMVIGSKSELLPVVFDNGFFISVQ